MEIGRRGFLKFLTIGALVPKVFLDVFKKVGSLENTSETVGRHESFIFYEDPAPKFIGKNVYIRSIPEVTIQNYKPGMPIKFVKPKPTAKKVALKTFRKYYKYRLRYGAL